MGQFESRERIHWVNDVDKAVMIAGITKKPVLLMILKSLCPTCKNLEPGYVQDKDFRMLSKFFVMSLFSPLGITGQDIHTNYSSAQCCFIRVIGLQPVNPPVQPDHIIQYIQARSVDRKQIEELYEIDGHYVPRVLFLDSTGKPMEEFYNESAEVKEKKFFYPDAEHLVNSMRNVLYQFYSVKSQDGE